MQSNSNSHITNFFQSQLAYLPPGRPFFSVSLNNDVKYPPNTLDTKSSTGFLHMLSLLQNPSPQKSISVQRQNYTSKKSLQNFFVFYTSLSFLCFKDPSRDRYCKLNQLRLYMLWCVSFMLNARPITNKHEIKLLSSLHTNLQRKPYVGFTAVRLTVYRCLIKTSANNRTLLLSLMIN